MNELGIKFIYIVQLDAYPGVIKEKYPHKYGWFMRYVDSFLYKEAAYHLSRGSFVGYVWRFINKYRIEDE